MNTLNINFFRWLAAAAIGASAIAAHGQSWTFDTDAQGWTASDLPWGGQSAIYTATGVASPVDWNPAGYISKFDPSDGSFFFSAPLSAATDYSSYVGGKLNFSLATNFTDWANDSVVILRGLDAGTLTTIVSTIPLPGASWTNYAVGLHGSNFRFGSQAGPVVSDTSFKSIMGSLSTVLIPAEYGRGVKETTSLDSVSFTAVPEPSTYAALLGAATLGLAFWHRRRR
jgi:hypothetical protein